MLFFLMSAHWRNRVFMKSMSLIFALCRFERVASFFLVLMTVHCAALFAAGQDANHEFKPEIQLGLGGHVKLGKWAPIFVESQSEDVAQFEVDVLDGDGTPVVYSGRLLTDPANPGYAQAWTRIGRTYGNVSLRLLDSGGKQIYKSDLAVRGEGRIAELQASTREMIMTLEPGHRFKKTIESVSSAGIGNDSRIVIASGAAGALPLNWIGYDGLESVVLVTSDLERVEKISERQLEALDAWVKKGGVLIFSAAQHADVLFSAGGKLARFCPGEYGGLGKCQNSKRLETFCDSREQLITLRGEPLDVVRLKNVDGRVLVDNGKSTPLIVKQTRGFGQVVFVAFDLDAERITGWSGFSNLVGRLVSNSQRQEDDSTTTRSARGNSVSHFGYEDLIGQLRVPMDRFANVKFVKFALVAVLIGLYILCIGPGDYFFLRKLVGKMELTWITFPLLSLLFCGLAIGISRMTRPNSIQLNQLEIIDVDAASKRVRGNVWTNLYSPSGANCSIELDRNHELGFEIDSEVTSWHGLPGDGLGGMLTTANPGLLKSSYEEVFEVAANGQDVKTRVVDLPLQVSSTKSIFTQWWSESPVRVRSRLRHNPRLQQITGTVTNPFDFTLNNCRLVFENWAYLIDQPLEPGQTFDIQTEADEKTLKSMLTRKVQRSESDRSDNSPWDPTDTRVSRIADIMMFYQAAGGNRYTGLTHDFQSFIDMSDHINLKRAILIGEVDSRGAGLKINDDKLPENYDNVTTIVRVVFPVEYLAAKAANRK